MQRAQEQIYKLQIYKLLNKAKKNQVDIITNQVEQILNDNPTISRLDFESDYLLGDVGVTIMANILERNNVHTLTELDLSDKINTTEALGVLFNALQNNTTLTELDLSQNELTDTDIKTITNQFIGLRNNHKLLTLHLNDNHIGDGTARILATILKHNTTLTSLDLNINAISDFGAEALANVISGYKGYNNTLKWLDLSENEIEDPAIIGEIEDYLQENQT